MPELTPAAVRFIKCIIEKEVGVNTYVSKPVAHVTSALKAGLSAFKDVFNSQITQKILLKYSGIRCSATESVRKLL